MSSFSHSIARAHLDIGIITFRTKNTELWQFSNELWHCWECWSFVMLSATKSEHYER